MRNWWHRSLVAQVLVSMLVALFVSQTVGLFLSFDQYRDALRVSGHEEVQSRAAAVARLVEVAPPDLREELARVSSTDHMRFWLTPGAEQADLGLWLRDAFARFRPELRDYLDDSASGTPVGAPSGSAPVPEDASENLFRDGARWSLPIAQGDQPDRALYLDFAQADGAGVIVPLSDGTRLNVAYYKRIVPSLWATHLPVTLGLTAFLVALVGTLTIRRIVRPLRDLTLAADTLGRGEPVTPIAARGPDDIRRTAEAFNRMQERLHRFVEDRTRMLAAIGHDLRTPLTILRLRAELVEDAELQARMLGTIDEMQAMTEATMTLARQEIATEPTRTVDLASLVESICDDFVELGHNVVFEASGRLPYRCRPDSLRRSLRNLIENAVRYAGHARVSLSCRPSVVEITVADGGPGIPIEQIEAVFTPFYRLEQSRSRETGGIGLGLSIARAIVRQHGGDIVLTGSEPGLKAAVLLPA